MLDDKLGIITKILINRLRTIFFNMLAIMLGNMLGNMLCNIHMYIYE